MSWLLESNPTPFRASCDTQFDFNKLLSCITPQLSSLVSAVIKHQVLSPAVWLDRNSLMKSSSNPCDSPCNLGCWYSQLNKSVFGWCSPFPALPAQVLSLLWIFFGAPSAKGCPSPSHMVHQGCQALPSRDPAEAWAAAAWQPQVNPPPRTQPWVTGGDLQSQTSGSSASDIHRLSPLNTFRGSRDSCLRHLLTYKGCPLSYIKWGNGAILTIHLVLMLPHSSDIITLVELLFPLACMTLGLEQFWMNITESLDRLKQNAFKRCRGALRLGGTFLWSGSR